MDEEDTGRFSVVAFFVCLYGDMDWSGYISWVVFLAKSAKRV
jgi:hypothetical protein